MAASILLFVFVVSTVGYITWTIREIFKLQEKLDEELSEVERMEDEQMALAAEISRLRQQEQTYANTLKIMQDDLPTLEVLNAFGDDIQEGMGLNTFRFTNPAQGGGTMAVLDATAAKEEDITALSNSLQTCGVFSSVTIPTIRRDEKTGRVSFTLNLVALPIGQINSSGN
ncbi:MAG: hypothetical protein LBJ36_12090 [Synergistaceae bacterium]|nr:hypothetical protein [Synergistaceae bacterium]